MLWLPRHHHGTAMGPWQCHDNIMESYGCAMARHGALHSVPWHAVEISLTRHNNAITAFAPPDIVGICGARVTNRGYRQFPDLVVDVGGDQTDGTTGMATTHKQLRTREHKHNESHRRTRKRSSILISGLLSARRMTLKQ